MSLEKYNALLKVLEHHNITKAAAEIGYTQSGISYMIKTLEKEFGFPLLIRSKEGVSPTENALKLEPILKKLMLVRQELEATVGDLNHTAADTIRIGSYNSMLLNWVPQILRHFSEQYPQKEISLIEGRDAELEKMLKEGNIDLAFTAGLAPEGYSFLKLEEDPFLLIVPKDHPLAKRDTVSIRALAGLPLVLPEESYYDMVVSRLTQQGIPEHPGFSYLLRDASSILSMVVNHLAISILPRRSLPEIPPEAAAIPFEEGYSRPLGITYPSRKYLSPVLSAFIETSKIVICESEL